MFRQIILTLASICYFGVNILLIAISSRGALQDCKGDPWKLACFALSRSFMLFLGIPQLLAALAGLAFLYKIEQRWRLDYSLVRTAHGFYMYGWTLIGVSAGALWYTRISGKIALIGGFSLAAALLAATQLWLWSWRGKRLSPRA